jgi:hypothetical protein
MYSINIKELALRSRPVAVLTHESRQLSVTGWAGALLAAAIAVLGRRWLRNPVSPMTRTGLER